MNLDGIEVVDLETAKTLKDLGYDWDEWHLLGWDCCFNELTDDCNRMDYPAPRLDDAAYEISGNTPSFR